MKAVLTIDDDLLAEAERLAAERSLTVDALVSQLLRQSLKRSISHRTDNGFPVFSRTEGAPPISNDDLDRADEDF
jgi:Arc/MetJ family transcription regulator